MCYIPVLLQGVSQISKLHCKENSILKSSFSPKILLEIKESFFLSCFFFLEKTEFNMLEYLILPWWNSFSLSTSQSGCLESVLHLEWIYWLLVPWCFNSKKIATSAGMNISQLDHKGQEKHMNTGLPFSRNFIR